MPITESNDDELRKLIFEKEKVIVKFTDEDCPICKILSPSFRKIATEPVYQQVTFVRMSARENPISSKEVKMTGTPFFATYRKGTLLDCGIVSTEQGIKEMLAKLLSD
ncbi:thioredoxin family protein [Pontibacter qinzhouensis]|uniref:Thioredoxin family protein n=1 Tax=Pontibacter qinzhouensis TaxID=2603253 RepID=A0A5C8K6I4_9BACT|nr:thioredoxin family protein [Pontibacter qinzhouensis]TXK45348.1 thioredoxin family protein [Pontibacter qinzhouensis]